MRQEDNAAVAKPNGAELPFKVPHPTRKSAWVAWSNGGFECNGRRLRVLAYDVSPSGWTDELTHLHEQTGGSTHFIDLASRRHACAEVLRCIKSPGSTVLEIGCSSGFLLRDLIAKLPNHRVFGADYTGKTLDTLGRKLPNVPLMQFDLTRCPLPADFVDVVVLLNVLEHIEEHETAFAELFRILRPGGAAIIEVPAGPSLFDVYDRVLMHHRRYKMSELIKIARQQGFIVEKRSHLGFFLFPAFYLAKRRNQLRYRSETGIDAQNIVAAMIKATRNTSPLMNAVMKLEGALRSYVCYPFGIRCLITCRKPALQQ